MCESLVNYYGGKSSLADNIISLFPKHEIYVEPFGGGASVLLKKPRVKEEVYNDLDSDMVNLFKTVREHPEELGYKVYFSPYSREEVENANLPTDDNIEKARRIIMLSVYSRNKENISSFEENKKHYFTKGNTLNNLRAKKDVIYSVAERMIGVTIENCDALELMKYYEKKNAVLFYLDPPYLHKTRKCKSQKYKFEISDDEHKKLLEFCVNSKQKIVYREIKPYYNSRFNSAFCDGKVAEIKFKNGYK